MEDLVDVCSLSRTMEKVLVGLSPFSGGLTLEGLAQRCGVSDLKTLRMTCREMEAKRGMLVSRRGAHGRVTWSMVGKLVLHDGWLSWTARDQEKPRAVAALPQPGAAGYPDCAGVFFQLWENPPAAISLPEPDGQKSPARPGELVQGGEIPAPGRLAAGPGQGISPPCAVEFAQNGEKPGAAAIPFKTESLRSESWIDSQRSSSSARDRIFSGSQEQQNRIFLKNAHLLFGKPVNWHESFSRKPPEDVLGWLAQAWKAMQNGKSDRPWGLVYRGLRGELRQSQPDRLFRIRPWQHLPESYLEACGLEQRAGPEEGGSAGEMEIAAGTGAADRAEEAGDVEAGQELPAGMVQEQRILNAWRAVLEQLGSSMARGTFARWVGGTLPVGWDESAGVLSVSAGSAEAAEWLESRLESSARRLLCGILNREVELRFVLV